MNSHINLTTATVRRMLLIAALVICPFLTINRSDAQSTVTATLTSGTTGTGPNSITITQNQVFTLTLRVTTNFVSSGYSVFYAIGNGGANFFGFANAVDNPPGGPVEFTPRTNQQPIFGDPTTGDLAAFNGPGGFARFNFGPGGNRNQFDLGFTGDQTNNAAAGTFNLQSLQFTALNAAPGTYTISLSNAVMTDRTGGGFDDVPFTASFTVNVIPEPTTVGLAVIGGGVLLVGAWRKRRAARA